jgi:hypothetical protein
VERERVIRVLESCDWKIEAGDTAEVLDIRLSASRFRMKELAVVKTLA